MWQSKAPFPACASVEGPLHGTRRIPQTDLLRFPDFLLSVFDLRRVARPGPTGHASAMAPGPKDPGTIALDWETNGYPKPAIVRRPWFAEFNRPETSGVVEMVQWVPK